jgi:hypothetical protein
VAIRLGLNKVWLLPALIYKWLVRIIGSLRVWPFFTQLIDTLTYSTATIKSEKSEAKKPKKKTVKKELYIDWMAPLPPESVFAPPSKKNSLVLLLPDSVWYNLPLLYSML